MMNKMVAAYIIAFAIGMGSAAPIGMGMERNGDGAVIRNDGSVVVGMRINARASHADAPCHIWEPDCLDKAVHGGKKAKPDTIEGVPSASHPLELPPPVKRSEKPCPFWDSDCLNNAIYGDDDHLVANNVEHALPGGHPHELAPPSQPLEGRQYACTPYDKGCWAEAEDKVKKDTFDHAELAGHPHELAPPPETLERRQYACAPHDKACWAGAEDTAEFLEPRVAPCSIFDIWCWTGVAKSVKKDAVEHAEPAGHGRGHGLAPPPESLERRNTPCSVFDLFCWTATNVKNVKNDAVEHAEPAGHGRGELAPPPQSLERRHAPCSVFDIWCWSATAKNVKHESVEHTGHELAPPPEVQVDNVEHHLPANHKLTPPPEVIEHLDSPCQNGDASCQDASNNALNEEQQTPQDLERRKIPCHIWDPSCQDALNDLENGDNKSQDLETRKVPCHVDRAACQQTSENTTPAINSVQQFNDVGHEEEGLSQGQSHKDNSSPAKRQDFGTPNNSVIYDEDDIRPLHNVEHEKEGISQRQPLKDNSSPAKRQDFGMPNNSVVDYENDIRPPHNVEHGSAPGRANELAPPPEQ